MLIIKHVPEADFQTDENVSAGQANKPVVAAFDFDGTLTRRDTLLPFLLHTLGMAAFVRHMFVLVADTGGLWSGLDPQ